ncbi:MAG: hypothetical protein DLD55_04840 [candidate division SR1 bacterium]|nr:MAG: hypothetical protein DLD55_04840 [candidate division SR1 bacterium]
MLFFKFFPFFLTYIFYLSHLQFSLLFNGTTLPLTITVKLLKRGNQTSDLLKSSLTLGGKGESLESG